MSEKFDKNLRIGGPFSKLRPDKALINQRTYNFRAGFLGIADGLVTVLTLGQKCPGWQFKYILNKAHWQRREMKRIKHGS